MRFVMETLIKNFQGVHDSSPTKSRQINETPPRSYSGITFFSSFQKIMPSGAIHPNSSNFGRVSRLNIVERMRKLVSQGAYEKRPEWLEFAERAPPMELHNLKLRDINIKSPYPAMIQYVLKQFPDMRFQDCFVDGNDWSKGNDKYRDDHPVMQFVARQLQLMNEGLSRKVAFEKTKAEYLERRKVIEDRQKIEMAIAQNERIVPAFGSPQHPDPLYTTGSGIARQREAQLEVAHLNHIRRKLRMLRKEIEPHDKRRMNAKEVALDMELERTSLLPKMVQSKYRTTPPEEVHRTPDESSPEQIVEYVPEISEEEDLFRPVNLHVVEEAEYLRDRKPRPVDLEEEAEVEIFSKQSTVKSGLIDVQLGPRKQVSEIERPVVRFRNEPSVKSMTSARPDKSTFQSIMAKKKLEKIIGKEPGQDDSLDFEDFVNLVSKK